MPKQTLVFESPVHGLPAERHRQGIPGNQQPLRQHTSYVSAFLRQPFAIPHKIRYIQEVGLIAALYELRKTFNDMTLIRFNILLLFSCFSLLGCFPFNSDEWGICGVFISARSPETLDSLRLVVSNENIVLYDSVVTVFSQPQDSMEQLKNDSLKIQLIGYCGENQLVFPLYNIEISKNEYVEYLFIPDFPRDDGKEIFDNPNTICGSMKGYRFVTYHHGCPD